MVACSKRSNGESNMQVSGPHPLSEEAPKRNVYSYDTRCEENGNAREIQMGGNATTLVEADREGMGFVCWSRRDSGGDGICEGSRGDHWYCRSELAVISTCTSLESGPASSTAFATALCVAADTSSTVTLAAAAEDAGEGGIPTAT